MAIGTLTLVAGCPAGGAADGKPTLVELRQSDASCLHAVTGSEVDAYDLNGDKSDETLLMLWCVDDPAAGTLLEMVTGGADPATTHPKKLVLQAPDTTVDQLHFCHGAAIYRVIGPEKTQTWRVVWPKGKPAPSDPALHKPDSECP